jgi:hypothetical protein
MAYGFSTHPGRGHKGTITCNTTEKTYTVRAVDGTETTFKTWRGAERFRERKHAEALKAQAQKKRTREVFSTGEIPHLWMHQVQASARNAKKSVYFEGATIFSYGSHFPIAKIITRGKRKAVLFNSGSYSPTTSGHQSAVRMAIPEDVPVFTLPTVRTWNDYNFLEGSAAVDYYRAEITEKIAGLAKVHGMHSYTWRVSNVRELIREMKTYAKFFKLRTGKVPTIPRLTDERENKLREYDKQSDARQEKRHAARQARWAARQREWEEQRLEREKQDAIERAELAKTLAERMEQWQNGANVTSRDFPYPLLRIQGDEVITSLGARVPVSHACRGLKLVQACVNASREYVRNGHTVHLGHYPIDRIEVNGTLHAGCHVIPFSEIQRITPQLSELCAQLPTEQTEE